MEELDRLPRELEAALSGDSFRRRQRLVLPLLTTDPEGYPRASFLTLGEVRANSRTEIAVAVRGASRTALNLIRRRQATLLYMHRNLAASVQLRAGRGRVSEADPERQVFPLSVFRVRLDRASPREGQVSLWSGPRFSGRDALRLFSEELFAELGRINGA